MPKGKKKKDVDFQKVKLKVGRRLKRDSNETKAQFKSRKIILKEVRSHTQDPITALAHHSENISQHGKTTLLNHFNSALTPSIVKTLTKPIIDSLAKFTIDHSEQVRSATYRSLKTCLNHMKQIGEPVKEFAYLLKPYLDCAFTHIDQGISSDCLKFLEYLTNTNEPQVFEPMMHVLLRRFDAGNISSQELKVAQRLKNLYVKHMKRKSYEVTLENDRLTPLLWSPTNYVLDLDFVIHKLGDRSNEINSDREVQLLPKAKIENVSEEFLKRVPDPATDDLVEDRPMPKSKRFRVI